MRKPVTALRGISSTNEDDPASRERQPGQCVTRTRTPRLPENYFGWQGQDKRREHELRQTPAQTGSHPLGPVISDRSLTIELPRHPLSPYHQLARIPVGDIRSLRRAEHGVDQHHCERQWVLAPGESIIRRVARTKRTTLPCVQCLHPHQEGVVVAESVPLTARVSPTIAARLKILAAIEDRSVSYLVAEALERYLADEEWQLAEIQAAVAEADAPSAQVIAQEDLERWAEQIGSNPDVPPPPGRPRGDRASAA